LKRNKVKSGILLLCFFFSAAFSESLENKDLSRITWGEESIKDSVTSFREVNSNDDFVAVRGVTTINAPLAVILSVLVDTDFDSQKEWVPNLIEFKTIQSNTVFDRTLYVHIDLPWPIRDRDFAYRARIEPEADQKKVFLDYQSIETTNERKEQVVRGSMKTLFILEKIDKSRTKVEIRAVADPAGAIPAWAVNFAQRNYSYEMLLKIKEQVLRQKETIVVLSDFQDLF
jgi:hypothetical protein